ncbi:MAG: hypothetical protein ACIARR_01095 [Phycisphaerales bacterium JB059]
MRKPILIVASLFALGSLAAYAVAILNINSDTGEVYSDVGNAAMLLGCFLAILALHARAPAAGGTRAAG